MLGGGSVEFGLPDALWPTARRRAASWLASARTQNTSAAAQAGSVPSPDAAAGADARASTGITAAEAFRPGLPLEFERRRPRLAGVLGLLALAVIGVLIYLLVARGPVASRPPAVPRSHHNAAAAAHHASGAATGSPNQSATLRPVAVASAAAFGPGGPSQGDDPQGAALAVDGSPATSWHSDWYTTAQLGGLQSGTGLLLSLGTTDTIASATMLLSPTPGGTVELRAGNTPALADMPVVAMAPNPGRALTMRPSVPVHARYVLIWFISLPPDNVGTYQASVYDIRLSGMR